MNLPSDLKAYKAPRDLGQWIDEALAGVGLLLLAAFLLAFASWGQA